MELLFWLLVLIAVITLVGHGVWVAMVALLRALGNIPPAKCPVCQARLVSDPHFCNVCHWSARGTPADRALRISLRTLQRAEQRGLVDEKQLESVRRALIKTVQPGTSSPTAARPSVETAKVQIPDLPAEDEGHGESDGACPACGDAVPASASECPGCGVLLGEPDDPKVRPAISEVPTAKAAPTGETRPDAAPGSFAAEATAASRNTQPETAGFVADTAERARRFASRRTGPLANTASAPGDRVPRAERKPWSALLSAFMHEKNIRWGEVVGGLLIVSCSIALVVSFWEHIASHPLLKFGIFTGVTACLFGLGLYASHRWKLPTTSQGVLMIAMMLVPLNFLALASFAEASQLTTGTIVGEFATLGVFLLLGFFASRVLTPAFPSLTNGLVVGLAFCNLAIRRFVFADPSWEILYALALPMVVCYLGCLWPVRRAKAALSSDDHEAIGAFANRVWKLLGLASFAFALAAGLLIVRAEHFQGTFQRLAPLIMLAAAPAILTGTRFWQTAKDRELRFLLVPSSGVALAGIGVMLAGIGLSWPIPWLMIATCTLGAALCLVLAVWLRLPEIHLGVAGLLSVAVAVAGLVASGALTWNESNGQAVLSELLSVTTGFWYTGFSALLLGVAVSLRYMSRPKTADTYALAAVLGGMVGAALITTFGFGRYEYSVSISVAYAMHAILFYLAARYLSQSSWQWLAGAAIAGACFQGIYFGLLYESELLHRLVMTLLTVSIIYTAISVGEQISKPRQLTLTQLGSRWPFEILALAGCLLTTLVACVSLAPLSARLVPWAWAGIASLWFVAAWRYADRPMFATAQVTTLVTMALAIDDYARTCDWYSTMRFGWLHPYSLEWHAAGLALFGIAWLGLRHLISRSTALDIPADSVGPSSTAAAVVATADSVSDTCPRQSIWRRAGWLTRAVPGTVDEWATGAAVVILFTLAVYAAAPGVLQELLPADAVAIVAPAVSLEDATLLLNTGSADARSVVNPEAYELLDIPHHPIGSSTTWWLLALVAAATFVGTLERNSIVRRALFVTTATSVVYLLAARWEPVVSVASALRWNLGLFFLIGNALLWLRRMPAASAAKSSLFGVLCLHALSPLVALAVCVAAVALRLEPPGAADSQLMLWLVIVGVVALTLFIGEQRATRANWLSADTAARRRAFTITLAILGSMPALAITLYLVGTSLALHPVTGPDPTSLFARMGLAASYSIPILFVAAALAGTASAFRSAAIGLWAGIVLNVSGTAAYLLTLGSAGFEIVNWLQLAQINATISALFALGWSSARRWRAAAAARTLRSGLQTQLNVACGFFSIAIVGVLSVLWWNPRGPVTLVQAAVPWGWVSTVTVVAIYFAATRHTVPPETYLPGVAVAISALVGCMLQDRLAGPWDASYLVMALLAVSSVLVVSRMIRLRYGLIHELSQSTNDSWEPRRLTRTAAMRWWVCVVIWTLTLFAFRFLEDASARPWPTAVCLLVAAALAGVTGWIELRWRWLWSSAILVNLAFTIIWIIKGQQWQTGPNTPVIDLVHVNAFAAMLPTLGWVFVIRHWKTRLDAAGLPARASAVHRYLVPTAILMVAGAATVWMIQSLGGSAGLPNHLLSLATIIAGGWACWASYWDDEVRWQSLGLYTVGLCAVVTMMQALGLSGELLTWSAPLMFGAFSLAACYLISRRVELRHGLAQLHLLPQAADTAGQPTRGDGWLIVASCMVAGVSVALAFLAQFRCEDQTFRAAASLSVLAQALALALLTRRSAQIEDEPGLGISTTALRFAALGLGVVATIANGWSYLDPASSLPYERLTVVAVACGVMAIVYGLGLVKLLPTGSPWIVTARQLMPTLIATSAAIVAAVMALEITSYVRFETQPPWFAIVGITITLGITLLACMTAAVIPGRDPLGLPDKARSAYVYAAEVALLLIVVHLRISMPWLFSGWVQQMWPMLIMLVAFAGIGLSEWARRYSNLPSKAGERTRYRVLIGPLGQTGAILPLLPALGYWMLPSHVHYSLVMVVVGLSYGVLAQLRKSFGFSVLAALAANGSLWFLLHDNAISLLAHPQVWLIPPAVCVLLAAQLNKQRISPTQLAATRYACSTVIYVSSTAEIFITGVAEAPWLPLVLAGFSLAGIAVGIAAHIRAFLWLGLSFLAVSMMTIIWYAAVDLHQTWLWYVSGIVMGVIILAVFAVFEKRRTDVLRWADELRQWEA